MQTTLHVNISKYNLLSHLIYLKATRHTGNIILIDAIYSLENWVGAIIGVYCSMYYFMSKGMSVASPTELILKKKLTINEPFRIMLLGAILNVFVAFLVVCVFYEARSAQQFGFASMSALALLSGHLSLKDFKKGALGETDGEN